MTNNPLESLLQMSQEREQILASKPQGGNSNNLFLRQGDIIFFQFVSTGNDGDRFIKFFQAHQFDGQSRNGNRTATFRYCTRRDGNSCTYCDQGHNVIKDRMDIWMYVENILRATIPANTPPDRVPQRVEHMGKIYYNEIINDFRIWHASAWRNSPWPDIVNIGKMYNGLNLFKAQMETLGENLTRLYKIYAIPNSQGLSAELYNKAVQELTPIPQMLANDLATPVVANPATQQTQPSQSVQQFNPSTNNSIAAFVPPGATQEVIPVFSLQRDGVSPTAAINETTDPVSPLESMLQTEQNQPSVDLPPRSVF